MKLSTGVIHRLCATPKSTLNLATYLTDRVRSILAGEPLMRIARRRSLVLSAVLCVISITPANAMTNSDYYKLYLHSRVIDYKQFKCGVDVGHRESKWNHLAANGSHFGIFQMRNKRVQHMNPYTQIDWWLRYVQTRYKGDLCLAWDHLRSKGWQ